MATARTEKHKLTQKSRPTVHCEGKELKNVFLFKYLGSIFSADDSHQHDITRRITLVMKRYGQLRNVFDSPDVPVTTKINIYKSAVMSLLTYGCAGWAFTEQHQARVNGASSRCLTRITGKSIQVHQEASARTQSFNIATVIRKRK